MKNYYFILLSTLAKWKREISCVGIKDWWFFVVTLKRNEFNPKLDIGKYCLRSIGKLTTKRLNKDMTDLTTLRDRAHKVGIKFKDLETKNV